MFYMGFWLLLVVMTSCMCVCACARVYTTELSLWPLLEPAPVLCSTKVTKGLSNMCLWADISFN